MLLSLIPDNALLYLPGNKTMVPGWRKGSKHNAQEHCEHPGLAMQHGQERHQYDDGELAAQENVGRGIIHQ